MHGAGTPEGLTRRHALTYGVGVGAMAFAGALWGGTAMAPAAHAAVAKGVGPYGPLLAPDAHGLALPSGFTSRVVARSSRPVGPDGYVWPGAPDGGACFGVEGGGWLYVANSELATGGGASMLAFSATGALTGARRILGGTRANCAGGATPWGRWLSCEEIDRGLVYDCDPTGAGAAVARPAMGLFKHEAAAVDADRQVVYLTEDEPDGCFYRFRPSRWPDLSVGALEVLCRIDGALAWHAVPDPAARTARTRYQVSAALRFNGGEGCWSSRGSCFFTAKGEGRVWQYSASAQPPRLEVLYDAALSDGAALTGVDTITGSAAGDLFVAEDGGNMELCVLTSDLGVAPFVRITGHPASEVTGPAFSPGGSRLYFSSQRGSTGRSADGVTYEVTGPFRHRRRRPGRGPFRNSA